MGSRSHSLKSVPPWQCRAVGLEGHSLENRRGTALAGGGSEASEAAVEAGLRWLAAHQAEDGGWSFLFDPDHCPQCTNQCRNPGMMESNTASTGLSLLCFLAQVTPIARGRIKDRIASDLLPH